MKISTVSLLGASFAILETLNCPAQDLLPPYVINNFDSASEVNQWWNWWGQETSPLLTFDPLVNAGGGASGSGSMKVTATPNGPITFGEVTSLSGNIWDPGVTVPSSAYATLSLDIRWDPNSTVTLGNYPYIAFSLPTPQWQNLDYGWSITPATDTDWVHVSFPVSLMNQSDIAGFMFYIFPPSPGPSTVSFWIDNIQLTNVPEPSTAALFLCTTGVLLASRGAHFRRHSD